MLYQPSRKTFGWHLRKGGNTANRPKMMIVEKGKVKVIKKDEGAKKTQDDYIRSHELSLLHLLARKYPQELRRLVEKCCRPQQEMQ